MTPISAVRPVVNTIETPSTGLRAESGEFFASHLKASMETVEGLGKQASQSTERFLNGEGEELHNVALAMQKAELSFELFLQVRNKVVQAYQEVMRMQI
jgi:flagellar hook-basal body complex protein FliE